MSVPMSACAGCRNDFYNGKNPLGVKECWSRKGAKMFAALSDRMVDADG